MGQLLRAWPAALAVVLWSTPVAAQERVAVLGFFGPNAGAARSAVRRVMAEGYEVVDMAEWNQAANRLGAKGQASRQIARVARELNVKAVVTGGVRRARRAWAVAVVIRDGGDGEVLGRRSATIRAPGRAAGTAGSLARGLMAFIDEADGPSANGSPPPQDDPVDDAPPGDAPPDNPSRADDGGDDFDIDFAEDVEALETERPPGMSEGGSETGQAADDEFPIEEEESRRGRRRRRDRDSEDDEEEREPRTSTTNRSPYGFLDLALEINITQRIFSVGINPLCDYRSRPRSQAILETGVFSEIGLGLSFYPGALFSDRWWAHLGLEFIYRHHLVLKILNETQGTPVEASEQAVGVGFVYRVPVRAGRRLITILPRLGWGLYSFFLSDVGNDIIPPFDYNQIYLGLNTHIPLVRTRFALSLGASYLAIISPGREAVATYNGSGLLPSSHGVQISAGFSGQIYRGLSWQLGFEFLGFFTSNEGKGRGLGADAANSTICNSECARYASCVDPETGSSIVGGIETIDTARDIVWRLVFQASYRFGWRPEDHGSSEQRRPRDDDRDADEDNEDVEDVDEPLAEDDEDFEVVDDDEDWNFE